MNDSVEISSAQYREDIITWLSEAPDGALPAIEIYDRIEEKYRNHFTKADLKLYGRKGVKKRPKWMNAVDWAKATGASQEMLATVHYKMQKWVVLLDYASDEFLQLAEKKRKNHCFMKRCRRCKKWNDLQILECKCGYKFKRQNKRRRVDVS